MASNWYLLRLNHLTYFRKLIQVEVNLTLAWLVSPQCIPRVVQVTISAGNVSPLFTLSVTNPIPPSVRPGAKDVQNVALILGTILGGMKCGGLTDWLCWRWWLPVSMPGCRMPLRTREEHASHQAFPWEHLRSRCEGSVSWLPSPALSVSSHCLSSARQPKSQNSPLLLCTATSGYKQTAVLACFLFCSRP